MAGIGMDARTGANIPISNKTNIEDSMPDTGVVAPSVIPTVVRLKLPDPAKEEKNGAKVFDRPLLTYK